MAAEVFTDPVRLAESARVWRLALERCRGEGCECRTQDRPNTATPAEAAS